MIMSDEWRLNAVPAARPRLSAASVKMTNSSLNDIAFTGTLTARRRPSRSASRSGQSCCQVVPMRTGVPTLPSPTVTAVAAPRRWQPPEPVAMPASSAARGRPSSGHGSLAAHIDRFIRPAGPAGRCLCGFLRVRRAISGRSARRPPSRSGTPLPRGIPPRWDTGRPAHLAARRRRTAAARLRRRGRAARFGFVGLSGPRGRRPQQARAAPLRPSDGPLSPRARFVCVGRGTSGA